MKKLRAISLAVLFALGAAVPVVVALSPATAHTTISRVAEGPTPTPTTSTDGPSPCTSGGC